MRLIADMTGFKGRLLLSTALTAAVFIPVSATADPIVVDRKQPVDNSGVIQGEYRLDSGAWTGSSGDDNIKGVEGVTGVPGTATLPNGIYQESGGGVSIQGPATRIDFNGDVNSDDNGAVIWDASAYVPSLGDGSAILNSGMNVGSGEVSGDVLVNNGTFTGAIDIRKGAKQSVLKGKDKDGNPIEYGVQSKGDLVISGGSFYFSKDSQFKMYDTNTGTLYMRGGNWNVGYDIGTDGTKTATANSVTVTVDAANNELYLRGGEYNIAEDSVLKLTGLTGTMDADSASYKFSGKGTLSVGFGDGFTINSDVKWDDGNLKQEKGSLTIEKQVTVNSFTQDIAGSSLIIMDGGVLSVASDVKMNGNMTGKGTLKLTGTADGEIGGLTEFGTIIVGGGELTFTRGNDTQKVALDNLIGAEGNGEKVGTINVAGQTYAGTVTLNDSVMKLTAELITDSLDMGRGDIVFVKGSDGASSGRLTLKGETTIWNNSRIITEATSEYADATSGVVTAKDGTVLTFADAEETDENTHFESGALTVFLQNDASMVSNARQVSFDKLQMTKGAATVESGILNVNTVILGDGTAGTGTLTVNDGGTVNVNTELTANLGAKVAIDGVLNVVTLTTTGQKDGVSTITGSGTLNITKSAVLNGQIDGLAHLNVTGTSGAEAAATFGGEYSDRIGEMKVTYGTVLLEKAGTLTIDSLLLDHGAISLNNEQSVLALRQSPGEDGGISGDGNSISGKGTLQLLNSASIKFAGKTAGNVGYLGGLKIGQGTATITGDTTLGSVSFSDDVGGALQIDNGATLTLSDETLSDENGGCTRGDSCRIVTSAGNVVRGDGTLRLVNGDGSTFYGIVDLGRLTLVSGVGRTVAFNSAAESKIGVLDTDNQSNIVVGGVLTVGWINGDATVFGNGTLTVNGQENGKYMTTGTGALTNLKIGGNLVVKDAKIGNVFFTNDSGLTVSGTATVSNITAGANNAVSGDTLALTGGTGTFHSGLDQLSKLNVTNATLNIMADTQVGNTGGGLSLGGNATVNVGAGKTLTVAGTLGNGGDNNVITGGGSLALDGGVSVDAVLNKIGNVGVKGTSQVKINKTADISGNLTVDKNSSLLFNGGTIGNTLTVGGVLAVNGDTTAANVANDGTINIAADTIFTVTGDINTGSSFKGTNLTSVLRLAGNATGTLNAGFNGTIQIGHGTLTVNTTDSVGAINFIDDQGGTLDIVKELTVGQIKTAGSNRITGAGTLTINASGSEFRAAISNLGTLKISGSSSDARFYNDIQIDTLAFNNGGSVILNEGMAMTVTNLTQSGTAGSVYGNGAFVAGTGDVALSTGGNYLASATIGSGTMNFVGDSSIGTLRYSSPKGTINISGVTVEVGADFSGIGVLKGDADAKLNLKGNANAVFKNAEQFKGNIAADAGSLTFHSTTDLTTLNLNTATAKFLLGAKINTVNVTGGLAEFTDIADVETINVLGTGGVRFKKAADIEALHVGSGYALFDAASTVGTGDINAGGVLNIGSSHLTVDNGNFNFNDNSSLALHITRDATKSDGTVNPDGSGYGRISVTKGTLNIYNNVRLDLTIDYGLNTAKDGSVFTIIDGTVGQGDFVVSNNRYDFKAETCGSGRCYRLTQTATGGEVAEKEKGNQNQIDTAQAFLDADLFDPGTKIFEVAEHLDALSQKNETARSYLNALTALAPDVTGAMTRQQIAVHSKISNTLSARLNGLMGTMGSSSKTYRDIQRMYGRSGGSPYNSRYMRAQDYYRRAGYYDQDDRPVTRPRPAYQRRIDPQSAEAVENRAERKRWAKRKATYSRPKNFGLWAQGYYNTAEYLSANKPEGFSGDTTGFAIGADVELLDVFAVGLGYASTSASVDSLQRKTDVTGDSFFLYGMYKPSDWFVSGILNMTSMSYDEQKDISGLTLTDKYDGSSFGANLMIGKDLKTWTPAVGLRYVSAGRDAHQDEIGQNVPSVSVSTLSLAAEARWKRDFAQSDSSLWHGELSAGMTYDLSSSGESATVSLPNGAAYTVKGDEFNALGVELGGTIAYMVGDHVDISAGYNLEWRQDYLSHTLTAMFRYSF